MEEFPSNPFRTVLDDIRDMVSTTHHIYFDISSMSIEQAHGMHSAIQNSPIRFNFKTITYVNRVEDILEDKYILVYQTKGILPEIKAEIKTKIKGIKAFGNTHMENRKLKYDSMFRGRLLFENIIRVTKENAPKNCIRIIAEHGAFVKRMSMAQIMEKLPDTFVQIEKRDIVNTDFVMGTNDAVSIVFMKGINGAEITDQVMVGKHFQEALKDKLDNGLFI